MQICQHYFPSLKGVCPTIDINFYLSLVITINSKSTYVALTVWLFTKVELSIHHLSDKISCQPFTQPINAPLLWSPGQKLQFSCWALPLTFMLPELTATTLTVLKLPYLQHHWLLPLILCNVYVLVISSIRGWTTLLSWTDTPVSS